MDKYLQEAIESYESQIASGHTFYMDAPTLMDIEEYYEKQGKEFEAEQVMRFAEKLHPHDDEVLIVKAYRLKVKGLWHEAKQIMNSVINHEHREVRLFWAEWAIAGGELDEAEQQISAYISSLVDSEIDECWLDFCEILLDYGYYSRALEHLNHITSANLQRRIEELRAECYFQLQLYQEAIECTEQLIDSDPYDALAWTQLAEIQQKIGLWQDSINSCDYALAIDENNRQAMNLKVYATFALFNYEKGVMLSKEYIRMQPNDYSLRLFVAEQLYNEKSYQDAYELLNQALRCCAVDNAERKRIIIDTAYCLARLHRPIEAIEMMHTLELTGNSMNEVLFQTAGILQECNYSDAAIRLYEKAFTLPTTSIEEQTRILGQLYQTRCFRIAASIWKKAYALPLGADYQHYYAYIAYALHEVRDPQAYLMAISIAKIACPQQLVQIMQPIYQISDPNLIYQYAQKEAETWESN